MSSMFPKAFIPDVLGSQGLNVVVNPKLGYTTVASLRFRQDARVNIWEDGTVEVDAAGIQADRQGVRYVSQRVTLDGQVSTVMVRAQATAAVAKPPDVSEEEKTEQVAASRLSQAETLLKEGKADRCREYCAEILAKYPKTKAAEGARNLLEKMKKER